MSQRGSDRPPPRHLRRRRGPHQGPAARAGRAARRHRQGQPPLRRRRPVDRQDRRTLARPARPLRPLELRLETLQPLGTQRRLGEGLRGAAGPRPGVADPRLHHRPRPPARRRRKKGAGGTGGQQGQALGRSRGGFSTKVHAAVSGLGLPVKVVLTAGQEADVTQAGKLIEGVPFEVVIADKGYDKKALVEEIAARGAEAVIPTLSTRKEQRDIDRERYKGRNLAERFWQKVKQFRRVATRYEKTARNFLAFVHVASIMILLR